MNRHFFSIKNSFLSKKSLLDLYTNQSQIQYSSQINGASQHSAVWDVRQICFRIHLGILTFLKAASSSSYAKEWDFLFLNECLPLEARSVQNGGKDRQSWHSAVMEYEHPGRQHSATTLRARRNGQHQLTSHIWTCNCWGKAGGIKQYLFFTVL